MNNIIGLNAGLNYWNNWIPWFGHKAEIPLIIYYLTAIKLEVETGYCCYLGSNISRFSYGHKWQPATNGGKRKQWESANRTGMILFIMLYSSTVSCTLYFIAKCCISNLMYYSGRVVRLPASLRAHLSHSNPRLVSTSRSPTGMQWPCGNGWLTMTRVAYAGWHLRLVAG